MLKKEKFNIEDSNVAALGSDMDKKCRVDAAATEAAWKDAGKQPGMQIWRIEKFQVKASKTASGTFYSDDSYICLNTYKKPDGPKLFWDIHFWLGETTSLDEAGTAAYKTVELDDFLGGSPVQHREVQGKESATFCSYFDKTGGIRLLEGGIESGFNRVKPTEYRARLLHLKGRKKVRVSEVALKASSVNEGDVFILDGGLKIYQWQGKKAGMNEKARGGMLCRALIDERKGLPKLEVFVQGEKEASVFWDLLGGKPSQISEDIGGDADWETKNEKVLMKLSDETGQLVFEEVARKNIKRSMLDSEDAFVFDIGNEVFVWVGKGASPNEKKKALNYAQQYLVDYKRPNWLPISRILEGGENEVFEEAFDSNAARNVPGGKKYGAAAAAAKNDDVKTGDDEMGMGCYLTYEEASNGTLFLNWKEKPLAGALAYFNPGKKVPKFKFKSAGGKSELTRACDSSPKNKFQAWCNFVKMAQDYKGSFLMLTDEVQVYFSLNKGQIAKCSKGQWADPSSKDAVGVVGKANQSFEGAMTLNKGLFMEKAQSAPGAALPLD